MTAIVAAAVVVVVVVVVIVVVPVALLSSSLPISIGTGKISQWHFSADARRLIYQKREKPVEGPRKLLFKGRRTSVHNTRADDVSRAGLHTTDRSAQHLAGGNAAYA